MDNKSTRALMATIDRLVAERDAAERRESELGLQVVAQAARLRLATETIEAARVVADHTGPNPARVGLASLRAALAAWDAVPGDQG